ncbi:MAG TPA: type II secretion system protein [Candidatus Paceibacterota bacterium]
MKKGFTLIELLVVIAIIGILSAVVLASLNGARLRSKDAKRLSDISQLQLALELYYDACKQFPTSLVTTQANGCTGVNLGTFIDPIPKDPDTSSYAYAINHASTPTNYHLGGSLEMTTVIDRDKNYNSTGWPSGAFNGNVTARCGSSGPVAAVLCYDVTGQ